MEDKSQETDRARSRRGGGGKLSRSETVTVRLDPKLNYLCELAARAHRRTKSSFIEYAVEQALASVSVPGRTLTMDTMGSELWDVDEPDRLVKLGLEAPALMTHEEQVIWKIIKGAGFFWLGKYDGSGHWIWGNSPSWANIREHWDLIQEVANGEKQLSDLPVVQRKVPLDDDLDVPF